MFSLTKIKEIPMLCVKCKEVWEIRNVKTNPEVVVCWGCKQKRKQIASLANASLKVRKGKK